MFFFLFCFFFKLSSFSPLFKKIISPDFIIIFFLLLIVKCPKNRFLRRSGFLILGNIRHFRKCKSWEVTELDSAFSGHTLSLGCRREVFISR